MSTSRFPAPTLPARSRGWGLALVLVVAGVPAEAATRVSLSFSGPRPVEVFELTGPDRIVLDFPRTASGHPGTPLGSTRGLPGVRAVRRFEEPVSGGVKARVTLELEHPAPYWMSWGDSSGSLNLMVETSLSVPGNAHPPVREPKAAPRAARSVARVAPAPDHAAEVRGWMRTGALDRAAAALGKDSNLSPTVRSPLLAQLALAEQQAGSPPAQVEAHAREAVQLGQEGLELDLALGRALDRQQRSGDAVNWYRRALQISSDPRGVDADRRSAAYLLGDALYRAGEREDAQAAYVSALNLYVQAPEAPWALYQVAKLHLAQGRTEGAREALRQLETRFPQDAWTRQARSRLGSLMVAAQP